MTFADFLVKNNYVSKEKMIKCLIKRLQALPPLLQTFYEESGKNEDLVWDVITKQVRVSDDLISILKEQDSFSDEKIEEIVKRHFSKSPCLSETLINEKILTEKEADELLKNYLSSLQNKIGNSQETASSEDLSLEEKNEDLSKQESQKMTNWSPGTQEKVFLGSLIKLFSKDFFQELSAKTSTKLKVDENLAKIRDDFHRLKGAARLAQASCFEKLVSVCENYLQKNESSITEEGAQLLSQGLEALWKLNNCFLDNINEEEHFSDSETSKNWLGLISQIEAIS